MRGHALATAATGAPASEAPVIELHSEASTTLLDVARKQSGGRPLVLNFGSCS